MTWLKDLLKNDESGVSFGHVACCFVILYLAVMAAVLVLKAPTVPAAIPDIPGGWVYVIAILWGAQKAAEVFGCKKAPPAPGE